MSKLDQCYMNVANIEYYKSCVSGLYDGSLTLLIIYSAILGGCFDLFLAKFEDISSFFVITTFSVQKFDLFLRYIFPMFLCLNFSIWLSTSEYLAGKAHLDYIEEEKMFELKNLNENREKKILELSSKLMSQGLSSPNEAHYLSSIFSQYDSIFLSLTLQEDLILPYNYYHIKTNKMISLISSIYYGFFFFFSSIFLIILSIIYSFITFSINSSTSNAQNFFSNQLSINLLTIPSDIFYLLLIISLILIISFFGAKKESINLNLNRLYNDLTSFSSGTLQIKFPSIKKSSLFIHFFIGIICSAISFLVSYSISFIYSSGSS